jgi:hypothetical protein
MEFAFDLTKDDLFAFQINYIESSSAIRRMRMMRRSIVPILAIAYGAFLSYRRYDLGPLITASILGILYFTILPISFRYSTRRNLRKLLDEGSLSSYVGQHVANFKDDCITCKYPGGYAETKYESISRAIETADHFFLYTSAASAITLPKRGISNEVMEFIRKKWPTPQ